MWPTSACRNINKEYILKRTQEVDKLQEEIDDLADLIAKPARIKRVIIAELKDVRKRYAQPRLTEIVCEEDVPDLELDLETPDYPSICSYPRKGI